MTKEEKDIIESTKEFAKAHNIHYDQMTENMILNAMRDQLRIAEKKFREFEGIYNEMLNKKDVDIRHLEKAKGQMYGAKYVWKALQNEFGENV